VSTQITSEWEFHLSNTTSSLLDLIRSLSAQAVLFGHCISFLGILPWLEPPLTPYMQNLAVVIFFLLSGFLIPYTVVRNRARGGYSWRHFFIDRFARIYSGYIPGLLVIFLLDFTDLTLCPSGYKYHNAWGAGTFLANVFMLQDNPFMEWAARSTHAIVSWIPSFTSFGSGRPLWTLAIEWWIYLFFGWVALGTDTLQKKPLRFVVVLIFVAWVPVFNALGGRGNGLMWVWLAGTAIFEILRKGPLPVVWQRYSLVIAGLFVIFAACRFWMIHQEYDVILALLLAVSLYFTIAWTQVTAFNFPVVMQRVIRITAGYSLTLYVIHYSLAVFLIPRLKWINPYAALIVVFLICNIALLLLALPTEMRHKKLALRLKSLFA
jgi:peptidoglycan/LPS O-acetylase OafA/YrhL